MPRKRKKLVEDFEELLEAGDLDALKAVYDTCALDAVFGYSKDTALALRGTPPELMRGSLIRGSTSTPRTASVKPPWQSTQAGATSTR